MVPKPRSLVSLGTTTISWPNYSSVGDEEKQLADSLV
jgi:hypothetical protein